MAAFAVPALADDPTPSTNDNNIAEGWAHFNVTATLYNRITVNLVQPNDYFACFEFRSDGDTSQAYDSTGPNGGDNWNTEILDGLYPYECLSTISSLEKTLYASDYVEIRFVFGGEGDERFGWERLDVADDVSDKVTCKSGGWETYGFDSQGQCVRFLTSGKDSR